MNKPISQEAESKKKCCEQSFLASVAGLSGKEHSEVGPIRRALGFFILAGVHIHLIVWSALVSLFRPRYRRVLKFQLRYFKDVMAKELRGSKESHL